MSMVKIPHYNKCPLLISLIALCVFPLFCVVILGQRYTTQMVTVVRPVTSLHHMTSLHGSSRNCILHAGIVSLMYSNIPPPLLHILSFLNITYPSRSQFSTCYAMFNSLFLSIMLLAFKSTFVWCSPAFSCTCYHCVHLETFSTSPLPK